LDDYDQEVLAAAAPLVSLALMRRHEADLLDLREHGNLLAALASGGLHPRDAAARAGDLGLDEAGRLLLPAGFAPRATGEAIDGPLWAPVWKSVVAELRGAAIGCALGVRPSEGDALAVVALRNAELRGSLMDRVTAVAREAARRRIGAGDAIVVVAGRATERWDGLPGGLREVSAALQFRRGMPATGWLDATKTDVDRWLWQMRADPALGRFVEDRLGPLLDHDRRRKAKLLPTLEALFDHNGHKGATARAMHLSRQALYRRLERIERLLSCDLDDGTTRLELHVATRARRHVARGPTG
jgi:purine catabolism regulator